MPSGSPDAVQQLYQTLHRYAGWLDRERTSVTVRADVQALGVALDTCADTGPLLQALDADLARLPGSAVRKMLRVAAENFRHAVEAAS